MQRKYYTNLSIGDSSSDEEVIFVPSNIQEDLVAIKPYLYYSYLIKKASNDLIIKDSVLRESYLQKKTEIHKKVFTNKVFTEDIILDKELISLYLNYKNSKYNQDLETRITNHYNALINHQQLKPLLADLHEEQKFYLQIKQDLYKNIVTKLTKCIEKENYDELNNTYFCSEQKHTVVELVKHILNPYFKKLSWDTASDKIVGYFLLTLDHRVFNEYKSDLKANKKNAIPEDVILNYVNNFYEQNLTIPQLYSDAENILDCNSNQFLKWYKYNNSNIELMDARSAAVKSSKEKNTLLYLGNYLIEYLNIQNEILNSELINHRPQQVFSNNFFVDHLLDKKILKTHLKVYGIKQEQDLLTISRKLPIDRTNETSTLYSTGTRGDLKHLGKNKESYEDIAICLKQITNNIDGGIEAIIQFFKNTLHNNPNDQSTISHSYQKYLYKVADLIFNLEPARNISAFITSIMFFDLVQKGIYKIEDLPYKMPMAMKGAIDASRLANVFMVHNTSLKIKSFDYKKEDESCYGQLKYLELVLKELKIINDYLHNEDNKDLSEITNYLNKINKLFDFEKKHFNKSKKKLEEIKKLVEDICIDPIDRGLIKKVLEENASEIDQEFYQKLQASQEELYKNLLTIITNYKVVISDYQSIINNCKQLLHEWYPFKPIVELSDIDQLLKQIEILDISKQKQLLDILTINPNLKGSGEYGEEKDIDYINSYFGKYTLDALSHILHLRINDLQLEDIKILHGIFINKEDNNITDILSQISYSFLDSAQKAILVPLNLFNNHAAGMIFEKGKNNTVHVKYLDSLNKHIPEELKQLITNNLGSKINLQELTVEQQKYANCGAEVIENFILYLTGKRMSQEKAIELHSQLVENVLLNIDSSSLHLLFEEVTNKYSLTEYLEQIKHGNNQYHNFDYENYHPALLGQDQNETI